MHPLWIAVGLSAAACGKTVHMYDGEPRDPAEVSRISCGVPDGEFVHVDGRFAHYADCVEVPPGQHTFEIAVGLYDSFRDRQGERRSRFVFVTEAGHDYRIRKAQDWLARPRSAVEDTTTDTDVTHRFEPRGLAEPLPAR